MRPICSATPMKLAGGMGPCSAMRPSAARLRARAPPRRRPRRSAGNANRARSPRARGADPIRLGNLVKHILHGRVHIPRRGVEPGRRIERRRCAAECAAGHCLAQPLRDGECQFFCAECAVRQAIDVKQGKDNGPIESTSLQRIIEMLEQLRVIGQTGQRVGLGGKLRLCLGPIDPFSRALQLPKAQRPCTGAAPQSLRR
jgi:hypothetical protein